MKLVVLSILLSVASLVGAAFAYAQNSVLATIQDNCKQLGAFTVDGRFYRCEEKTKFYIESEDFK